MFRSSKFTGAEDINNELCDSPHEVKLEKNFNAPHQSSTYRNKRNLLEDHTYEKYSKETEKTAANEEIENNHGEGQISSPSYAGASSKYSLCNGRFELIKQLSSGSFGYLFKGIDYFSDSYVAVKIENSHSLKANMLKAEYRVYRELSNSTFFPEVIWFGSFSRRAALVLEVLDEDLASKFADCNNKFSVRTAFVAVYQVLKALEYMHSKGIVHRDLKPENILLKPTNADFNPKSFIKLIDFGLAIFFQDKKTGRRLPPTTKHSLAGTPRFAPLAGHIGVSQSPKDDVESLLYICIYFIKGRLPWQRLKGSQKEVYKRISELKANTPLEQLCENTPFQCKILLEYVRSLGYFDEVNYSFIYGVLEEVIEQEGGWPTEEALDWNAVEESFELVEDTPVMREEKKRASGVTDKKNGPEEKKKLDITKELTQMGFSNKPQLGSSKKIKAKSDSEEGGEVAEIKKELLFWKTKAENAEFELKRKSLEVKALRLQLETMRNHEI